MSSIRSNLKEVMEHHNPKLSIRKLAKDVNYHFDSIRRMYKDEMVQYPRDLLVKLCIYFNVLPGQLIVLEEDGNHRRIDETFDHWEDSNDRETNSD